MAKFCLNLLVGAALVVWGGHLDNPFRKLRKEFDFDVFGFDVRNHLGWGLGRDCWVRWGIYMSWQASRMKFWVFSVTPKLPRVGGVSRFGNPASTLPSILPFGINFGFDPGMDGHMNLTAKKT